MSSQEIELDIIGGHCPVQAEGRIGGKPFYFRARGNHWYLGIGGIDPVHLPGWFYEEHYGDGSFDAGYMTIDEALAFISKAARCYFANESIEMLQ